ncbi:hypothetical protein FRC02_007056 [Tulasnella sp. 418]|nr:hypothetical protein FRC02_007056 [Tulasnella sp. 418]
MTLPFLHSGASYCSTSIQPFHPESGRPSAEQPLGTEYPGQTYSGEGKANWVGHVATTYNHSTLLVYNYARGGSNTKQLVGQVQRDFLPHAGRKPDYASWAAQDSLFITWIGINDVGTGADPEEAQKLLFQLQDELYQAGARNFLIFNVPPMPKLNAQQRSMSVFQTREKLCERWNQLLPNNVRSFQASHDRSSVFLFDAHQLFKDILANPSAHGFSPNAGHMADGEIWVDNIHPTEEVHDIIAQHVAQFLDGID